MAEPEVKTEEQKPNPAETAAKEAADLARKAFDEMNQMKGQLSVIAAAATASTATHAEEEPTPDIVTDTEKALDMHVRKRTQPLIDQQLQREAAREKELIELKAPKDWKDYGSAVEKMIQDNRISNEILANPGAYEKLLNLVKAERIDEIVNKQVQEKMAAAALSSPQGKTEPTTEAPKKYELTDKEKRIAQKLGVSEADWVATAEKTSTDGLWISGETA